MYAGSGRLHVKHVSPRPHRCSRICSVPPHPTYPPPEPTLPHHPPPSPYFTIPTPPHHPAPPHHPTPSHPTTPPHPTGGSTTAAAASAADATEENECVPPTEAAGEEKEMATEEGGEDIDPMATGEGAGRSEVVSWPAEVAVEQGGAGVEDAALLSVPQAVSAKLARQWRCDRFSAHCTLPAVHYLITTTLPNHYLLYTSSCSLLTAHCSPLTTHRSSLTAHLPAYSSSLTARLPLPCLPLPNYHYLMTTS